MLTNPNFGYWKHENLGYVPDIWFQNSPGSQSHYNTDSLIAVLLSTLPQYYSAFLKIYGALGPHNARTYFESLDDCIAFLDILEYLYTEIHEKGNTWLSTVYELLSEEDASLTQSAEEEASRTDFYLSNAKTYWNQQQQQGIPWDINITKKEAKDMNTGKITYNPFKPGRSKKPTHYTMLHT